MDSTAELDSALKRLNDGLAGNVLSPDLEGLNDLARLVPNIPSDVGYLYSCIGGTRSSSLLYPYLMPPREVASTVRAFRKLENSDSDYARSNAQFGDGRCVLLLIYDEQSNYIGLHLQGAHAGKAFLLDHDEPDTAPKFNSLAEVLGAMADGVGDEDLLDATYIGGRR